MLGLYLAQGGMGPLGLSVGGQSSVSAVSQWLVVYQSLSQPWKPSVMGEEEGAEATEGGPGHRLTPV